MMMMMIIIIIIIIIVIIIIIIIITRAPSCKLHDKCILHALSHQRCLRLFRVCPSLLAYEKSSSPREHTAVQPQQHPGNL